MVSHGRDDRNMTPTECQAGIQTGLAPTHFVVMLEIPLEWAVTWSLVGEWTTRTIFWPPNKNGQDKDIRKLLSLRMINGRFLCSRGLELVLNKDHFLPCLPSIGSLCPGSPW